MTRETPQFVFSDWLHVRMEHGPTGPEQARRFFNATPTAEVRKTKDGYKVYSPACHPGASNDA